MRSIPTFDFVRTPINEGLTVIEASAGTGKTFAISHLVPRLLLEGKAPSLDAILLVTFTNAAAAELAQRVRSVLEKLYAEPTENEAMREPGVAALRQQFDAAHIQKVIGKALMDLDRLNACTIHSFCMQVLQTEGNLCGLPTVPHLVPDLNDRMGQMVTEHWQLEIAPNPLLAAIARIGGWSCQADQQFCATVGEDSEATFEPAGQTYAELQQDLEDLMGSLSVTAINQFESILEAVQGWNNAYPGAPAVDQLFDDLRSAINTKDWLTCLHTCRHFADAEKWIRKQGKINKACAEDLKDSILFRISNTLEQRCKSSNWSHQLNVLASVRKGRDKHLADNRLVTYDGLVRQLHRALTELPAAAQLATALRERFAVGLIDESQDTDQRQYAIFKRIFLDPADVRTLLLIGDPKQAIYGFRGADLNTYLQARDDAGAAVYSLTQTFRAPQPLVACVNALFAREQPFHDPALQLLPASSGLAKDCVLLENGEVSEERLVCWTADEEPEDLLRSADKLQTRLAQAVADTIAQLIAGNCLLSDLNKESPAERVRPAHCAVLVADRFNAYAVKQALARYRIPAVTASNEDILTSEEATDLLALLKAVREPRNSGLLSVALTRRLVGRTADELGVIMDDPDETVAVFSQAFHLWQSEGIAAAITWLDSHLAISQSCAAQSDAERRLTNFRQLQDLLVAVEAEQGRQPEAVLRWLTAGIASASNSEERQMQLESDAEAVQIVTMHAAKGLEYPLVFCPFLWKARDLRVCERLNRPKMPPHHVHTGLCHNLDTIMQLKAQSLRERLRLAYVALTRARVKAWCFVGHAGGKKTDNQSVWSWLLADDNEPLQTGDTNAIALSSLQRIAGKMTNSSWLGIRPLPESPADSLSFSESNKTTTPHALPVPQVPAGWGLTSFSALTREKSPFAGDDTTLPVEASDPVVPANALAPLAGGVNLGTAVHDWLEQWDFKALDPVALANHLRDYPLGDATRQQALTEALLEVLNDLRSARLAGLDATIAEACPLAYASEWTFHLPLRDGFSLQKMATIFERHGYGNYASQLAMMPDSQLRGFLHGFIDRLVYWQGAWGVIDWKTNKLGIDTTAYAQPALQNCVEQQHYFLQAVLYLLALRRFLPQETPVAGAWVVFLRGIQANSSAGILSINPPSALLQELDELFVKPS